MISELRSLDPSAVDYANRFESALTEIIALRDPDVVAPLLSLFDDECPHDEVMFSLIHGIEVFDDMTYVRQVLLGAVDLCSRAPRWASIVLIRILNSETARSELIEQLREADPGTKAAIKSAVERLNARGAQFIPKTTAVLLAAS